MNISRFDLAIIFIMSIVVISMSFAFPAMGLTGSEAEESDIPTFNISTNAFDFRSEFPADVERKELGSGEIDLDELPGDNFAKKTPMDGEFSGINESDNYATETWELRLGEWDNSIQYDSQNVSKGEEFFLNDSAGYQIHGEFTDEKIIEYRVIQGETDDYSGIIGGIYRIADIIYWFVATVLVTFLNLISILLQAIVYFVTMMHWLISTYFSLITGSPTAWGSVFVTIPAIILFAEFSKITIILVHVLWLG